jgi:2-oxoglutarate ferredoxin oxidoreductase subunit beta
MNAPDRRLAPKDYASGQEVRWCPGCGDYAILRAIERTLADLGADPARTVFVSGIGCAARLPYYLATYGLHGIHGRAPAIATGIKLANPDLDVWVAGGDGDMLSIGGNHLAHLLRRDVDVTLLLFNNEVYGLTKGQLSPTAPVGTRTPSSPLGSVERPLSACLFALGAGARFVARAIDTDRDLPAVLRRAHDHPGTGFVEILQNCIVYNDGAFADITDREVAADRQLRLVAGEPLRFGRDNDKGLALRADGIGLEVIAIDGPEAEARLLRHDPTDPNLAWMLAALEPPMPVALGVIYENPGAAPYERGLRAQEGADGGRAGRAGLAELLKSGPVWYVPG